jgi:hypothetical protein
LDSTLDEIGLKYGTDKASSGHDYLFSYERFLSAFRNDSFTLLEIGGLTGASLRMWSEYFPNAKIVCLDINPKVKEFESSRVSVEIGNAADQRFLKATIEKHGPFGVVLDDGSHRWDHLSIAFNAFYDGLVAPGIYIVEDLHTNFEGRYAGTYDVPFFRTLEGIAQFMSARGDARRALHAMHRPTIAKAAAETASVTFIRSACILVKRLA